MTLPLTRDVLAAAYDFLAATEPFCRWNLPDSDDVVFRVVRDPAIRGKYQWHGRHVISISGRSIGHTISLMETMAHEIVHLHEEAAGMSGPAEHGAAYGKLAAAVCKVHGFDPKLFW